MNVQPTIAPVDLDAGHEGDCSSKGDCFAPGFVPEMTPEPTRAEPVAVRPTFCFTHMVPIDDPSHHYCGLKPKHGTVVPTPPPQPGRGDVERVRELEGLLARQKRQTEIAEAALAEAAKRFAAKDMEGVRLLLCDRNARENAAALIDDAALSARPEAGSKGAK